MEFLYEGTSGIAEKDIKVTTEKLLPYIDELLSKIDAGAYTFPECSLLLPSDEALARSVLDFVYEIKSQTLKYVFLVGIGGSSLGAKALYETKYSPERISIEKKPELFFIDAVDCGFKDGVLALATEHIQKPEDFIVIVVSKSGTTVETLVNLDLLHQALCEKFKKDEVCARTIVITDKNSALEKVALRENIRSLTVPPLVGGRYSVFSAVGIFPLALLGFDTEGLRESARHMRALCLLQDMEKNPAAISAAIIYENFRAGKNILNTFFFDERLRGLGGWCAQLLAESIGKKKETGIIPTTAIGTNDLHSLLQLYLATAPNTLTLFGNFEECDDRANYVDLFGLAPDIKGKTVSKIREAAYFGTKEAYHKAGLPYIEVIMKNTSEVGGFMQFKMLETMYLAQLLNVNAFDQPA